MVTLYNPVHRSLHAPCSTHLISVTVGILIIQFSVILLLRAAPLPTFHTWRSRKVFQRLQTRLHLRRSEGPSSK